MIGRFLKGQSSQRGSIGIPPSPSSAPSLISPQCRPMSSSPPQLCPQHSTVHRNDPLQGLKTGIVDTSSPHTSMQRSPSPLQMNGEGLSSVKEEQEHTVRKGKYSIEAVAATIGSQPGSEGGMQNELNQPWITTSPRPRRRPVEALVIPL